MSKKTAADVFSAAIFLHMRNCFFSGFLFLFLFFPLALLVSRNFTFLAGFNGKFLAETLLVLLAVDIDEFLVGNTAVITDQLRPEFVVHVPFGAFKGDFGTVGHFDFFHGFPPCR